MELSIVGLTNMIIWYSIFPVGLDEIAPTILAGVNPYFQLVQELELDQLTIILTNETNLYGAISISSS